MKLSRLFVIAMLVGTVGAFGCSDDDGGTGGTAGTGGGAGGTGGTAGTGGGAGGTGGSTDACVGPLCDASEPKAACNAMIEECNATAEVDLTPEQCDEVGNAVFCTEGAGGTGGNGGNGGTAGGGGTGGDLGCDVLACEADTALKEQCEDAVRWCFAYCETEECQEDECLALGLLICNVQEG